MDMCNLINFYSNLLYSLSNITGAVCKREGLNCNDRQHYEMQVGRSAWSKEVIQAEIAARSSEQSASCTSPSRPPGRGAVPLLPPSSHRTSVKS